MTAVRGRAPCRVRCTWRGLRGQQNKGGRRTLLLLRARYTGRGLFLEPPSVGMSRGVWRVALPPALSEAPPSLEFQSRDAIFDTARCASRRRPLPFQHAYFQSTVLQAWCEGISGAFLSVAGKSWKTKPAAADAIPPSALPFSTSRATYDTCQVCACNRQ